MKVSAQAIERWVWYVFLAILAWQTRVIVWQADVSFIEWRSASIYATDVCMAVLFGMALARVRGRIRVHSTPVDWSLGLLVVAAIFSLANAPQLTVGVIQVVRLLQFIAFFYYLRYWAWHRFDVQQSALAFVIGALAQALLGIGQYAVQHDLGLRWIGETLLRTDMRGVAVFYDSTGEKILRAYGTLPHPNILAAYLAVAFWFAVWLWVRNGSGRRSHALLWQMTIAVLLIGEYLTFSRTIIAAWVVSLSVLCVVAYLPRVSRSWPNISEIRRRLRVVFITVGVVTVCIVGLLWPKVLARLTISGSDEAVRLRLMYNAEAASTGFGRSLRINWTGVGIGNFTSWLSEYDRAIPSFLVQPVHNVYLLVYSEIGLFGLVFWIAWLAMICRIMWRAHRGQPLLRVGVAALLVSMLGIGMLDHFYWTLQQGRLLWWGLLALVAGRV